MSARQTRPRPLVWIFRRCLPQATALAFIQVAQSRRSQAARRRRRSSKSRATTFFWTAILCMLFPQATLAWVLLRLAPVLPHLQRCLRSQVLRRSSKTRLRRFASDSVTGVLRKPLECRIYRILRVKEDGANPGGAPRRRVCKNVTRQDPPADTDARRHDTDEYCRQTLRATVVHERTTCITHSVRQLFAQWAGFHSAPVCVT